MSNVFDITPKAPRSPWRRLGRTPQDVRSPAPRGPHTVEGTLSVALRAALQQRVRVNPNNEPRWVSGYEAVVIAVRERAAQGDMVACQLLTDLMKASGLIAPVALDATSSSAPPTTAEKSLSQAFAERLHGRQPAAATEKPGEPASVEAIVSPIANPITSDAASFAKSPKRRRRKTDMKPK